MFVVTSTSKSAALVLVFVNACLKMNPALNYCSELRIALLQDNVLNSNILFMQICRIFSFENRKYVVQRR